MAKYEIHYYPDNKATVKTYGKDGIKEAETDHEGADIYRDIYRAEYVKGGGVRRGSNEEESE